MTQDEVFQRYSRQIFIEEIGVSGQRKIMQAKVLVVGAGGIGSPVIQYLAASGVGTLGIVDFDRVELHNLNRQVIHHEAQVGRPKVASAAEFVGKLNSAINVQAIDQQLNPENAKSLLKDYDIVLDGSDNFTTRYIVNDTCVELQKPLVYGSIFGFEGQVAVFNYQGSKNLRDLFPEPPAPEDVPNCDRHGVLGPLPGMVGSMMAMEALKIITDLPVAINRLTLMDTFHGRFNQLDF